MNNNRSALLTIASTVIRSRCPEGAISREEVARAVTDGAQLLGMAVSTELHDEICADLESRLVVKVGRSTTLVDAEGHIPWYFGDRKTNRRFFERYRQFLSEDLQWPPASVDAIDESTDLIMEQLENPAREGTWDRRGLVVGHVQSGKTANYAGLVNKAADSGYKLIIVLAGMHNALRQQTQRRLDRDVLGYDTSPSRQGQAYRRIGVDRFDSNIHAEHLTTQAANGDFNRGFADNLGTGVQQRPVLMIVKKNARILENLNNWVREVLAPRGDTESRALLLIDDEADQASLDTGQQDFEDDDTPDPDYEPTRINGQIRRLLAAFSRSGYVAYTATPFANVLVHDAAEAHGYGQDLFPRSFIVNLPAPDNYVGPKIVFGINQGDSDPRNPIDVVRLVDQNGEAWIRTGHKKEFCPRFQGEARIPPSLEIAILSFVLACATRRARGQTEVHNSMLVHISRFKDVHQKVFEQVERWVSELGRALKYRTGSEALLDRLEHLWRTDFEPCTSQIIAHPIGRGVRRTSWDEVEHRLSESVGRIKVQVVNGDRPDAIDFDSHPEGLSIIAIGGDKLSRGLTLEGLTVSYFLRASRMYDSLMQMGRWFGYRPGYVDLCRLYMTTDLELWFRHVAAATEELRDRLDHMAMLGSTPEQYGLRIRSHDILTVTAPNKMRHAREFQVSFQGEAKIQTVFFRENDPNQRNAHAVIGFLDRLEQPIRFVGDDRTSASRRVWIGVPGLDVAGFLAGMEFPGEARDVNSARLSAYVREQLGANELTEWTVAVLSGQGELLNVGDWNFATVARKPLARSERSGRYVVKTILSPRDEALDLSKEQLTRALELTNRKRQAEGRASVTFPDGAEIRKVRGDDPARGLLLLYPMSPRHAELEDVRVPVFGVVVSFPDSSSGRSVRYRFNTIEQRLELA